MQTEGQIKKTSSVTVWRQCGTKSMERNREERRRKQILGCTLATGCVCGTSASHYNPLLLFVLFFFATLSNHVSFIISIRTSGAINGIFSLLVRVTLKTGVAALLPPATHFSDTHTHTQAMLKAATEWEHTEEEWTEHTNSASTPSHVQTEARCQEEET